MDNRRQYNGWQTFHEHFGILMAAFIAIAIDQLLSFFTDLGGMPWIYFFIASSTLLIMGAGFIVRAKIPVYRSGRFFTFGIKSVPESLAGFYRWGWRIFLFGVVLSLCLLLSKQ